MNHVEMRDHWKLFAGRYDQEDKIITLYLNNAAAYLSSRLTGYLADTFVFSGLAAGQRFLDISEYMSSVKSIWTVGLDGQYVPLRLFQRYKDFIETYPMQGAIITENPVACVKLPIASTQELLSVPTLFYPGENLPGTFFAGKTTLALVFNSAPSSRFDLRLHGVAHAKRLVEDTDYNIFTQMYPDLLAHAALYYYTIRQKNYEETIKVQSLLDAQISQLIVLSTQADMAQAPLALE